MMTFFAEHKYKKEETSMIKEVSPVLTGLRISAVASILALIPTHVALAADPICKKTDIRIVNSMREIAQPYHANLDKGGRLFAKWAGLANQYVLQLNQGDSDKQVSLMRSLLATNP